jgi:signal transduction histidine kinase
MKAKTQVKMRIKRLKKILNSLFTKLLLVLLITGICIHLSVTGFMQHMFKKNEPSRQKNILSHLNYIVRDIGDPPELDRAKKISQRLNLDVRYDSPTLSWSTSESLSLPPQMKLRTVPDHPNVTAGEDHGRRFFILQQGDGRFVFDIGRGFAREVLDREAVVRLIVILSVILAAVYLSIRKILSPVKRLTEGVREVGKGNLEHPILETGSDELGELGRAFNTMTDRIRKMLRAKEQLMLDVSHELRSPLTRMKVALESLSESKAKESIKEDVAEMEKMVTDVLQTARSHYTHGQLNLQKIDLIELLDGVLSTFNGQHPGILATELPDYLELSVDPDRVKSALKNVLENAVKYSSTSNEPVRVSLRSHPAYAIIHIEDHGVGIPKDELPYIFEPFYRVDKSRSKETGGYGLGLSLCKTILEAHHGKIEVESTPDKGTTVSLFFPIEGLKTSSAPPTEGEEEQRVRSM